MGRRDRWESGGPSSVDLTEYVRAMGAYHGAVVHFEIRPLFPDRLCPQLRVSAVAQPGPGPELASGPLKNVSVTGEWPTSSHLTFEGFAYALLVKLDYKLGTEWWAQRELPF